MNNKPYGNKNRNVMNVFDKLIGNNYIKQIDNRQLGNNVKLLSFKLSNTFPSTNIHVLDIIKLHNSIQNDKDAIKWSIVKSPRSNFLIFLLYNPHILNNKYGETFYSLLGKKDVNHEVEPFENSFQCIKNCIDKCGNVKVFKEDLFRIGQNIYYLLKIVIDDEIFVIDGEYFLSIMEESLHKFSLNIHSLKLINEKNMTDNEFYLLLCLTKEEKKTAEPEKDGNLHCDTRREFTSELNCERKNNVCWKERGLAILQMTTIAICSGATAIWGYSQM